jgi:hypothetical protein
MCVCMHVSVYVRVCECVCTQCDSSARVARRFLYPPTRAFYSKQPAYDWFNATVNTWDSSNLNAPLQCMQYEGDVIYVPGDWGHGVLNVQSTIGVAVEFSSFLVRY